MIKIDYWKRKVGWQGFVNSLNTYYLITAVVGTIYGNSYIKGLSIPIIFITILQKLSYWKWSKEI